MQTLTTVGIIFGFFVGLGALTDRLLLKHQKNRLHQMMYNWWYRLDNTKMRQLYKLMAEYSLNVIQKGFPWKFWLWKTWGILILISWTLTSTASILGYYLSSSTIAFSSIPLPIFTTYIANFAFDFLAIYVTLHVLKIIIRVNPFRSLTAITFDIFVSGILVILCGGFMDWGEQITYNNQWWGSGYANTYAGEHFKRHNESVLEGDGFGEKATIRVYRNESILDYLRMGFNDYKNALKGNIPYKIPIWTVIEVKEGNRHKSYHVKMIVVSDWFSLIMPLTTFIPTFIYMALLFVLIIGKIIIEITMHLLEVMTEPNPAIDPKDFIPGTLIGLLCSVIATSAKVIVEIIKVYTA